MRLKVLFGRLRSSDRVYLVYQLSKPVLGFLFLAGVLYLDQGLNESGCRFALDYSEVVLHNITNGSGLQ